MFHRIPFVLLALIAAIIFLGSYIPLSFQQFFYSLSLSLKRLIVFALPFIIFGLLFKSTVLLSRGATKMIGLVLALVCCSNFLSTFLSHYIGLWVYHFNFPMKSPSASTELMPLWTVIVPPLVSNDRVMFAAIGLGFIVSKIYPAQALVVSDLLEAAIEKALRGVVCFIPLFVMGFVIKLQYDGTMHLILKDYSVIFALIALAQFSYIAFVYFLLNRGNVQSWILNLHDMFPAALSGLSTMSSAASMPLTLIGVEKNAHRKGLVRAVIPVTVNIHLIGDCFAIPILAYAVLHTFGLPTPDFLSYLLFAFYFVLAKFSVAAIPGGGIIVMLPVLERHLGFNGEMLSLITALYILFDPVITCANVFGNGAFAKLIDRIATRTKVIQA